MKRLSWEDIEKLIDELAGKITASGFKPDYAVGITNGGLVPLYFLTKNLGIGNVLTVSAKSYEGKEQKDLVISYLPEISLAGKKVLLVDEITDTGVTLREITAAMIKKHGPAEIRSASLVVNEKRCAFKPDFHAIESGGDWIAFPWERNEDVGA